MRTVRSENTEVFHNLAAEEWLIDHAKGCGTILFVCVVIGKSQNPWRECRLLRMEKESVPPLVSLGVAGNDFPAIVEKAKSASSMKGNPVELNEQELIQILRAAL